MSYPTNNINSGWDNNNQQQGQGFNSDPNNFSNTGGRGTDSNFNDTNFDRSTGGQQRQDFGGQGFGGGDFGSGAGVGRGEYAGNTTDVNVPGAGGDFGSTGRNAGMQRDLRSDNFGDRTDNFDRGNNFDQTNAGQNFDGSQGNQYSSAGGVGGGQGNESWDDNNAAGGQGGKPSFGDRMKGTMETMAGKVSRNPNLVERGQERKEGFDNNNF